MCATHSNSKVKRSIHLEIEEKSCGFASNPINFRCFVVLTNGSSLILFTALTDEFSPLKFILILFKKRPKIYSNLQFAGGGTISKSMQNPEKRIEQGLVVFANNSL